MRSLKVSREKGRWLRVSAPGSSGWIDISFARYEILIRSALSHSPDTRHPHNTYTPDDRPAPSEPLDHVRLESMLEIPLSASFVASSLKASALQVGHDQNSATRLAKTAVSRLTNLTM